jgi:hypothetical protein
MEENSPNQAKHGTNTLTVFVTSLAAAICVAGGLGIVLEAFIVAAAARMDLGQNFVWVFSVLNGLATAWLFLWCFARSWHVERRLREGLEIDEPKLSILANLRGYGPAKP